MGYQKNAACFGKTFSSTPVSRVRNESRPTTTPTSVSPAPAPPAPAAPVAPMPPPILKKTRGPSGNGPRPTARFISPPASEDDESNASSTSKHVVIQSPSPPLEQTSTVDEKVEKEKVDRKLIPAPSSKKFVASASKKKRPVVVRRQSSQTSQSSNDSSARVPGGQGQQSKTLARPPPLSVQPGRNQNTQENTAPPRATTSPTKRNSSRLAVPTRGCSRKLASTCEESSEVEPAQPEAGPSKNPNATVNNEVPVHIVSDTELKVQRMLLDNAKISTMLPSGTPSPDSQTSITSKDSSNGNAPGYRRISGKHLLQHQSKGIVSSAPTLTDATGHLDLSNGSQNITAPASPERPSKGKARTFVKDLFTMKSLPVAFSATTSESLPAAASSGPLSKSKSQLSLLLERHEANSSANLALPNKGKQAIK